ncbi:bacterial regulatory s, gntR family protein [Mycobacterium xenopi 3993]|nr:bacterial regulatory s, gntR family protein [Mycobacterium xenopi 3993]
MSAPRIAEIVADELRRQIIDGELADGDLLPRQEVLVEQFNVSLVSLREALRILETEGLVSVRRGNRVVPSYTRRRRPVPPTCSGCCCKANTSGSPIWVPHCGNSNPRARRWPPSDLTGRHARTRAQADQRCNGRASRRRSSIHRNRPPIPRRARPWVRKQDHHRSGRHAGNAVDQPRAAVADESAARGTYPSLANRRAVLNTHIKLTEMIEAGDVDRARRIAARHLADTQTHVLAGRPDQRIYALSPQALSRPRDARRL